MDNTSASIDFAIIGHQESWPNISAFVNGIRTTDDEELSVNKIKNIFSFIPSMDIFRVKVKSKTGAEINGVYIETFIDPDKLEIQYIKTNINKVTNAVFHARKMGAKVVTLGGFTSIVLEGKLDSFSTCKTKFTTGNTLTAAFIVKGIERAAIQHNLNLQESSVLIVGATGDIGLACSNYLKRKVKDLRLCARNKQRLKNLSLELIKEGIPIRYSVNLKDLTQEADVIICVASSTEIKLFDCKENALICDAGYPKNIESKIEQQITSNIFHGGMGQVSMGFDFIPDYSTTMSRYPSPYIIHGCILEAVVLAFEGKMENYSTGKGNITIDKMEEIYGLSQKHGITIAPFYNTKGLW